MKRIHKFAAVGISSFMVTIALTPAALAAGARSSVRSGVVRSAASIPHTNIMGKPAHWSPSKFSAVARWTGGSTCPKSQWSFTYTNKKNKTETVKFTGTDHLQPATVSVPAHEEYYQCIGKGYKGTETGKLSDGKKLTVKF